MFALNFVASPGMLDVDVWDDGCGRILKFNPAPSTAIHSASLQCMEMERSNYSSLASLHLFGQLVCRLAVSPYTRWEALRTGNLTVSQGGNSQQSFARLGNWTLQLWPSRAAFR